MLLLGLFWPINSSGSQVAAPNLEEFIPILARMISQDGLKDELAEGNVKYRTPSEKVT